MGKYDGMATVCDSFLKYIDRTENYLKHCSEKISDCDKRLTDMDHCLLLEKLDAAKQSRLLKERKKVLADRLTYKNDYILTETLIKKMPNSQTIYNTVREMKSAVVETEKGLTERKYAPNIMKEIFSDNNTIESKVHSDYKKLKKVDKSGIIKAPSAKEVKMEELFNHIRKAK